MLLGAVWLAVSTPLSGAETVFRDVAEEVGLDFHYFNGMSGELYFPEMTGGGGALLDYDGDGDLDVFFVQGHMLGDASVEEAVIPPRHEPRDAPRLYRNDSAPGADGSRRFSFTDVTAATGIRGKGYGMGVTAGDYDGDGRIDLYVTNFGRNQLLRNRGDGTFQDVIEEAGAEDARWSVPAVFFDYDRDGRLDLFVGNYVDFRIATHKQCASASGARDYCGPSAYPPAPDRLFRNLGDGTFETTTESAGIAEPFGPALGATAADFDGDGLVDLYVANDGAANSLWRNRGDGTFVDDALMAGAAVNEEGQPEASMGVVAGDVDVDGDPDLFMTHLERETNTLYLNDGTGIFQDRSQESGLGLPSWKETGFGVALFDFDNDGIRDLFVANGAVTLIEEQVSQGAIYPLAQTNKLFRGLGGGRFEEIENAGEALAEREVSRGVATGDVDGDGDSDLVVVNNAGPAQLLLNRVGQEEPWIGFRLVTGDPPRDALGTEVELVRGGAPSLWATVRTDGSYASASDPRVLFGLGSGADVREVRVRWPDGKKERFSSPPAGMYTTLRKGEGSPTS